MATRESSLAQAILLPSARGHVTRAPPSLLTRPDAIEAFPQRVAALLRASRRTGRERGFLAYATEAPGQAPLPEADAVGGASDIRWRWDAPDATVAFSVHTHPGARAMCVPSGVDLVGALVRGDHTTYVLTMDGRLTGWRFRDPRRHAWAVDDALSQLDKARALKRGFLSFLHDAMDALRPGLVECVYAARVTLDDSKDAPGVRIERCAPAPPFFDEGELA